MALSLWQGPPGGVGGEDPAEAAKNRFGCFQLNAEKRICNGG